MEIEHIREYRVLTKLLNITNAANELFITQSALSRHLASIENELGTRLFVRTKHGVELTDIGRVVAEEFDKILSIYDGVLSKTASYASGFFGDLSLGMLYYAIDEYISPVIREFKSMFPNIKIRFYSYQPYQVIRSLLNGGIDVGMVMGSEFQGADSLEFVDIGSESLIVIASADHPFAARANVSFSELSSEALVYLKMDQELSMYIRKILEDQGVKPVREIYSEQVDTMAFTILETGGVCVLVASMRNMKRSDLAFVDIAENSVRIPFYFAFRKDNDNPAIKHFINSVSAVYV